MMKHLWKVGLALALALMMGASVALATDSVELELEKVESFFQRLVAMKLIPEGTEPPAGAGTQNEDATYETFYPMAEYTYVSVIEEMEGPQIYSLGVLHAVLPEGLDADDLYAAFVQEFSNQKKEPEAAKALVADLRKDTVATDEFSLLGEKVVDGETWRLLGSQTDSEEFMELVQTP